MARTPQSTLTCTMLSSEHAAHRLLMHSGHTSHLWLKVSPCVSFHVIHACALVSCSLSVSPHPSFYFLVLFLFQLYLMSNSAPDEFSIEDPLCNSSLGSMVTLDCVTPLTHSWVRISYGTVEYVNDSIEDDTENLADSQQEESVQTSSSLVAARSKAKAKPQPRESNGTTTIPLRERKWIDIEPSKQDLESYDLSKKVINLLLHNQKLHREQDGAIELCKIKFHLRNHHSQIQNWSDDRWKACLATGGGFKRRYQYCSHNLGSICISVLFKDILEAISLIQHYRTTC